MFDTEHFTPTLGSKVNQSARRAFDHGAASRDPERWASMAAGRADRVPYRVFQTEEAYKSEQNLNLIPGTEWHYACA